MPLEQAAIRARIAANVDTDSVSSPARYIGVPDPRRSTRAWQAALDRAQQAADEAYEFSIARGLSPAKALRAAENAHIDALTPK